MAETMKLQVITPDKEFFHGDVSMVELNTADGELGVYPQHIPLTTAAAPGVLKIHQDGQVKKAALLSGFLQILPEKMTILAAVSYTHLDVYKRQAETTGLYGLVVAIILMFVKPFG